MDQWNFVMHPVFAAKKCDPEGDYVRQWIPELAKLPVEYIHCPWEAGASVLAGAGVSLRRFKGWSRSGRHPVLPKNSYPTRCIVDLDAARLDSLRAVLEVRRGPGKKHICPSTGHELMDISGHVVRLITRVDYRESALKTRQTPEAKWDTKRRQKNDFISSTVMEGQRNIVV